MKFEDHCLECAKIFGKPFQEVHKWLDEFAGSKEYGMRHRHLRHHLKGVEKVKDLFGENASYAAKLHIISDLKEEGWKETNNFPKDEKDYKRMGLF